MVMDAKKIKNTVGRAWSQYSFIIVMFIVMQQFWVARIPVS